MTFLSGDRYLRAIAREIAPPGSPWFTRILIPAAVAFAVMGFLRWLPSYGDKFFFDDLFVKLIDCVAIGVAVWGIPIAFIWLARKWPVIGRVLLFVLCSLLTLWLLISIFRWMWHHALFG